MVAILPGGDVVFDAFDHGVAEGVDALFVEAGHEQAAVHSVLFAIHGGNA